MIYKILLALIASINVGYFFSDPNPISAGATSFIIFVYLAVITKE